MLPWHTRHTALGRCLSACQAALIEKAVEEVLNDGVRTGDLVQRGSGARAHTSAM